jgi:hypothetical protein
LLALAGVALDARVLSQQRQQPPTHLAHEMITPEAQRAIDQGLAYLAREQHPDGAWGMEHRHIKDVAISSLGGLAFLAGGHQPGRGPYSRTVSRAVEFVIAQETPFYLGQPTQGFLYNNRSVAPNGPMYGHGFGTLFLAETHGMVYERDLRERLRGTLHRAVQLIVRSQNPEGGWRYHPFPREADISVTICQVMALRAASNAGIFVPRATMENCIRYVQECQDVHNDGGFRYMRQGGPTGFARTAAGVVALNSAGIYEGEAVDRGLTYLLRYCRPGAVNHQNLGFNRELEMHFYYGHYYAVQAMWIRGGRYWREWFPAIRDELLRRRRQDGAWSDNHNRLGSHYCTAMACIILQVPNNYLPIFQR